MLLCYSLYLPLHTRTGRLGVLVGLTRTQYCRGMLWLGRGRTYDWPAAHWHCTPPSSLPLYTGLDWSSHRKQGQEVEHWTGCLLSNLIRISYFLFSNFIDYHQDVIFLEITGAVLLNLSLINKLNWFPAHKKRTIKVDSFILLFGVFFFI